jgi:predicted TIM-barrel fold metal-dependent hydrolase
MKNGLYIVDFHAHLQDCHTQQVLCAEDRNNLFFRHAAPILEQVAHLGEPYYSVPLRSLAINYHGELGRQLFGMLGQVFLMETLRLFKKYGIERLLENMERNSIDHVVIHSLEPLTATKNILQLIEPFRHKISVFASVHRNEPDPVGYFKAFVKAGVISGLKIHPQVGGFACGELYDKVKDLVAYAADEGLPIMIHTGHIPVQQLKGIAGCSEVDALEPLLAGFPHAKIILAHIGWESWRRVLQLATIYPNVSVETSWQSARVIRRAVDTIGPERVLFGSDFPLFDQKFAMQQVEKALSPQEFVLVASVNAKRLLRLPVAQTSVQAS